MIKSYFPRISNHQFYKSQKIDSDIERYGLNSTCFMIHFLPNMWHYLICFLNNGHVVETNQSLRPRRHTVQEACHPSLAPLPQWKVFGQKSVCAYQQHPCALQVRFLLFLLFISSLIKPNKRVGCREGNGHHATGHSQWCCPGVVKVKQLHWILFYWELLEPFIPSSWFYSFNDHTKSFLQIFSTLRSF